MSEIVERVARAIDEDGAFNQRNLRLDYYQTGENPSLLRATYLPSGLVVEAKGRGRHAVILELRARLAIAAMRDPTDKMAKWGEGCGNDPVAIWYDMIAAALSED